MANLDQFEFYFKRADLDRNGKISGAEAVSFFQASGLPKSVLAQIWTHADQNRTGYLGRTEFYNYLKLVTVAQSKLELTMDLVKAALYGPASAKIPAPQINLGALPAPKSNSNAGSPAPQIAGSAPAGLLQSVAPIQNGTTRPVAGNGFVSSSTFGDSFPAASSQGKHNSPFPVSSAAGLPVSSSDTPVSVGIQLPNEPTFKRNQQVPVKNSSTFPVRSENVPSNQSSQPWPKMSQSNVQKYTKVFVEVDTDRDGKITGEQAHTLFLSWRLPREILKQVWDLSDQDNDGMLSSKEFCIALYLMERYREGRLLPRVLPDSAIFEGTTLPPSGHVPAAHGAPSWRPPPAHGMTGLRQVTPAAARPPRPVPVPLPGADEDVQPRQQKHRVPVLEKHLVDQLSSEEKNLLNSKFQEATEADKKVGELEKEILEAKQKIEFYRNKMQEIVLYKSRCDNRLNEITERVSSDKREVESLSKKYEDKYKQTGDVASKLTIEEATFRDIQDKKMELYRAIVKLDQDGKPDDIQARVDRIQVDLEEQVKALNERCKMYGLRGKPTMLVELPFGWQPGIQEGEADWDENWDKFEDEGFMFVKELTLDVQNVIAPPKPKSMPVQYKPPFGDEGATTVSSSEKLPMAEDKSSDDESNEENKESPDSRKAAENPSEISQDNNEKNTAEVTSPHAIESQSEHPGAESVFSGERTFDEPGWGAFDNHFDFDATWDSNATKPKDTDQESKHENSFLDSDDGWGTLNPIRTEVPKKSTYTFDSVPGTPAYSFAGSPPGDNLFQTQGPFADSVPSTPAYSFAGGSPRQNFQTPFSSAFADSVPSTPMFSRADDNSFTNNISRFDSFSSNTPRDSFSRFDSFPSTGQESGYDQGLFPPQTVGRFDSEFGHSLFQPREPFSRFDSMRSTSDPSDFNRSFPSFDDADSHDLFKSETPRRDSVDGWKAF